MRTSLALTALLALAACNGRGEDTGPTLDTGWFADTGAFNPSTCPHRVLDTWPVSGEAGWYYRDAPLLWTATASTEFYRATLLDAADREVPVHMEWDALRGAVRPDAPLNPSSDYLLLLDDCTGTTALPFRTSALGLPLEGGPSSLVGRSWLILLDEAEWVEPAGFGALMSLYFTVPVLLGADWADASVVDLIGAQGYADDLGVIHQFPGKPTWDYPMASFTDAPWFFAEAEVATLSFDAVEVPVYAFSLEATFSADGRTVGGAVLRGSADTQDMGVLIGRGGQDDAICAMAASMGVSCVDCPDGSPYCLDLYVTGIEGVELEGTTLVTVE
ncbi:MAG: hypothetical protein JXX28_17600 [Deltaproteobacteria bacterium]|nr:hypothetical protein [Deltaproteobacteria bacterium]